MPSWYHQACTQELHLDEHLNIFQQAGKKEANTDAKSFKPNLANATEINSSTP